MGRAEPTACSLEEQRRLRASPNHYKSISFPFLGAVTGCFFFFAWMHGMVTRDRCGLLCSLWHRFAVSCCRHRPVAVSPAAVWHCPLAVRAVGPQPSPRSPRCPTLGWGQAVGRLHPRCCSGCPERWLS